MKHPKKQDDALPKSLWKFYFKYATVGSWWPLGLWAFFFMVTLSNQILFPYFERWFIALFETPVPAGMNFVQHAFDELADGRTTLAIAHRLSTLRNMDRIVVLKDGHVIEQGTHAKLLRTGGEYARLWKMQSGCFIQE